MSEGEEKAMALRYDDYKRDYDRYMREKKRNRKGHKFFAFLKVLLVIVILGTCVYGGFKLKELGVIPTKRIAAQPSASHEQTEDTSSGLAEPSTDKEDEAQTTVSGTLGSHEITLKGAEKGKDSDGNPILIVTYAWTNNSKENASAWLTLNETAFQDGVELDTPSSVAVDTYDVDSKRREIQPGATMDVQVSFLLRDNSSPVDIEITRVLDLDEAKVSATFDIK